MAVASRRKILKESVFGGLVAGATLASGQILVASATGQEPGAPWQLWSSVALGPEALSGGLSVARFFLGAAIHFGLSALFGLIFGLIVAQISRPVRNNLTVELWGGVAYGLVLWFINIQLIARWLYPWFATVNPSVQALLHAVFYGIPLAGWLALAIRRVEVPGVHEARHRYQTSTGSEEIVRMERDEALIQSRDIERTERPPPSEGPGAPPYA